MTAADERRRRRWRRLAQAALVLAAVAAVSLWQQRSLVSGEAPPLAGEGLDGQRLSLAAHGGRPVLVHFWATWCPVCALEQGTLDAVARDHPVIAVALDTEGADTVRAYMREEGVDYPVLPDPAGAIARRWGVRGVPASFVVDGAGDIRFSTMGYTTEWGLRLRLWLADLF